MKKQTKQYKLIEDKTKDYKLSETDIKLFFEQFEDEHSYNTLELVDLINKLSESKEELIKDYKTGKVTEEQMENEYRTLLFERMNNKHFNQLWDYELGIIKNYIASVRWQKARSKYTHWYTIKNWNMDKVRLFEKFVVFIRRYGYKEPFREQEMTYFDLDGFKYWTMGWPLYETVVINRARLEDDQIRFDSSYNTYNEKGGD